MRDTLPITLLLHPDPSDTGGAAEWFPVGCPFEEDQHRSDRRMPVDAYLHVLYVVRFVLGSTRLKIFDLLSLRGQHAVTTDCRLIVG